MYRTLLALLFSGISLLSHADNSYLIQARIRDVKDGTVFFLKQFSTQRIINAMRLEDGKLQMKGELFDIPQHLWLCTTIKDEFYYCDLLVDTGKIVVEGSIHDFPNGLHFEGAQNPNAICRLSEPDTVVYTTDRQPEPHSQSLA